MTQTLGAIRVNVKSGSTTVDQSLGGVRVSVNPSQTKKVHTVSYLPNRTDITLVEMTDVELSDNITERSVLTYNETTQKFVVQDVSRLEGGTF